jgi:hypothetical protein
VVRQKNKEEEKKKKNDIIWGWVQNMKLLILQLPPFSCCFIPLEVQIFSLEPCSQTPSDLRHFDKLFKMKYYRGAVLLVKRVVRSDSQEIPRILWNAKVHSPAHKSLPPVSMNLIHTLQPYFT